MSFSFKPVGSKIEEWKAMSDAKRNSIEETIYINFSSRIMPEALGALDHEVKSTGNKRVLVNSSMWMHQYKSDKFLSLFDRWVQENSELYNGLKCSYDGKGSVYGMYISFD